MAGYNNLLCARTRLAAHEGMRQHHHHHQSHRKRPGGLVGLTIAAPLCALGSRVAFKGRRSARQSSRCSGPWRVVTTGSRMAGHAPGGEPCRRGSWNYASRPICWFPRLYDLCVVDWRGPTGWPVGLCRATLRCSRISWRGLRALPTRTHTVLPRTRSGRRHPSRPCARSGVPCKVDQVTVIVPDAPRPCRRDDRPRYSAARRLRGSREVLARGPRSTSTGVLSRELSSTEQQLRLARWRRESSYHAGRVGVPWGSRHPPQ